MNSAPSDRSSPALKWAFLALLMSPLACGSGGGPICETRTVKSRLFDDQQTAVEWTIEACLLPGEPAQISVTVSGETLPGGSPVTPSNVVIVERNDAGQRVDSHGGANSSTVTFDVDPETKSINVTVGRQKGLVKDIEFSLDDL